MRVDLDELYSKVGRINESLNKAGYDIKVSAMLNPINFTISWTASHKGKVFSTFETLHFDCVEGRILQDYYVQGCCYDE